MKSIVAKLIFVAFAAVGTLSLNADDSVYYDINLDLNEINELNWTRIRNVIPERSRGWNNVVKTCEDITLEEAEIIAESNPAITHFMFVNTGMRIYFHDDEDFTFDVTYDEGDAVFFCGEPKWKRVQKGSADGYVKYPFYSMHKEMK